MGLCHAVMSGIAPQCPIVDLSHLVRPLEVASGALLLADSMPYISEDAVVLGVVDPTVGKDREVAIETGSGRHLVGPDNGLLSLAWAAAGGIRTAVELTAPDVAPAAARPVVPGARHALPGDGAARGRHADRRARRGGRPGDARRRDDGGAGDRAGQDRLRGDRLQPLRERAPQRPPRGSRGCRARRGGDDRDRERRRARPRPRSGRRTRISPPASTGCCGTRGAGSRSCAGTRRAPSTASASRWPRRCG